MEQWLEVDIGQLGGLETFGDLQCFEGATYYSAVYPPAIQHPQDPLTPLFDHDFFNTAQEGGKLNPATAARGSLSDRCLMFAYADDRRYPAGGPENL